MDCPICGKKTRVLDSRTVEKSRYRRRVCPDKHKTYTKETIVKKWPVKFWEKLPKKKKPGGYGWRKGEMDSWLGRVLKKLETGT